MDIINVLQSVSNFFGLDFATLTTIAISITVAVNFLKSTKPFSKFVGGNIIPYVTFALSLVISAFTMWGDWLHLILSAVMVTVLSVGGWATAKTLIHKVGKEPTSSSGGK